MPPTELPATPRLSFDVPSVVIPATTFVSVVPAPKTTALEVSDPPVAVTVPAPAGLAQVVTPLPLVWRNWPLVPAVVGRLITQPAAVTSVGAATVTRLATA